MKIDKYGVITDEKFIQATIKIEEIVKELLNDIDLAPLTNMERRLIAYQLAQTIDLTVSEEAIEKAIYSGEESSSSDTSFSTANFQN